MRIFLYTLLGLPILAADAVLLSLLPGRVAVRLPAIHGLFLLGGAIAYLPFHFLIRKPERMYLWAHEFTHLLVAKLFLRKVHGFHITSRSGGKVVIDRTNVAIDLAPYAVPLYNILALLSITLVGGGGNSRRIYIGLTGFLFSMHLCFSAEGFINGQPDLRRSGRVYSFAVVLLAIMLWSPFLLAPASSAGFPGIPMFFHEWMGKGMETAIRLFSRGLAFP
jgi:hypothetical protein